MAILTIQTTGVDDAGIQEASPSTNNGTSGLNSIGGGGASDVLRMVLRFDFSSLPAGSVINSATLTIKKFVGTTSGRVTTASRLTQTAWVETEVTWNEYSSGNSWASAGADFTSTDASTSTMPGDGGDLAIEVTALTQYFRDNSSSIADFLVKDELEDVTGNSAMRTTDTGTAGDRPKLVIDYDPPTDDVAFTLPQLSVQAGSGATGVIAFPLFLVQAGSGATGAISLPLPSMQAFGAAGADFSLPLLTLNGAGHGNTDGTISFPIITVFSVPPPSTITLPTFSVLAEETQKGNTSLTFPSISISAETQTHGIGQIELQLTVAATGLQGHVESATISLPAFTINITSGLTPIISLPKFAIFAEGENGYVGTFGKSLPRMIVNVKASQASIVTFINSLPQFDFNLTGLQGIVSISAGNRTLPVFNINARAFKGENGDANITLPIFALVTEVALNPNADLGQLLFMLTLDAYADVYTNRII